jgi:hypothetical protein
MDTYYLQKKQFLEKHQDKMIQGTFFGITIETNTFTLNEKEKIQNWSKIMKDTAVVEIISVEKSNSNLFIIFYIMITKPLLCIKMPKYFQSEFSNLRFKKFFEAEDLCLDSPNSPSNSSTENSETQEPKTKKSKN